jgi:hypothetical protein
MYNIDVVGCWTWVTGVLHSKANFIVLQISMIHKTFRQHIFPHKEVFDGSVI